MIRMMVADMLEELGYTIAGEAGDIDEAVRLVQATDFDIALVENAGTRGLPSTRILDLKPKQPEAGIARMLLEVTTKGYTVEKTTLFDAYGNTTAIALTQLKLNTGLDAQQFRFIPPAGVTVVTPGKP